MGGCGHDVFVLVVLIKGKPGEYSKQNYGAPKILRKSGKTISQRTVGKYMREMGIRAQWTKPWTTTTRDSDFSMELHNILNEQFNPERPNVSAKYSYARLNESHL